MALSIQTSTLHGLRTAGTVVSGFFFVCYLFTNEQPVSEPLPNTSQGPPSTYQTATGGTHFGFWPSAYNKPCPSYKISSVQNPSAPPSCVPGPTGLHGISLSRSSFITHLCPSISFEGSHLPMKSFQVPHPVSWTYSIHNLQGHMLHPSKFTQNSQPFNDDGNQSDNGLHDSSQFPQEIHGNEHSTCDIEPSIDEISPDEDNRMARRALRGINNHIKLLCTNMSTDPTPEHKSEDYSLNFEDMHQIPSDHDIGM